MRLWRGADRPMGCVRRGQQHGAWVVFLLATCLVHAVAAQEPESPLEPADTSSPRATLRSFLEATNQLHASIRGKERVKGRYPQYESLVKRIFDCLDLSELPEYARTYAGGEAAVCLKEVLDRVPLPREEDIPGAEELAEAVPSKDFYRWRIPETRLALVRIEEGPRRGEYLFSAETVGRAAEFYEDAKSMPYRTEGREVSAGFHDWLLYEPGTKTAAALVHLLPDWFEHRYGGLAVWQWTGLVLANLLALLAMIAVYLVGRARGERMREKSVARYCVTLLFPVAAMFVPLMLKSFTIGPLAIRGSPLYIMSFSANIVFLLAVVVVIVGASSRLAEIIIASPRIHPKGLDAQLIRIVCRLLSMVAALVVFLEGGKFLGIPLTTLLASAGVGGLAVALAAQDTLKSLFGSVMILLDKPYRVGERVIVGDYDGTVEEIGLRSTKLRLLTGHLATIPNEEMARNRIENVGRREHIRRLADIHIPLDIPRAKVEKAVASIRKLLENHEGMKPEFPPRVFFNAFNSDSFNLRIIYWYHPPNHWDFLAFNERMNFEIYRVFEEQKIQFSLPSKITYTSAQSTPQPLELKVVSQQERPAPDESK